MEREPSASLKKITSVLTFPLFVKPTHLGSSIGISRVTDEKELRNALEVAAHYDNAVIVEEAVSNLIEVTLPIMGNDNPVPALLEQPMTKPEDFFDFENRGLAKSTWNCKHHENSAGRGVRFMGFSEAHLGRLLKQYAIEIKERIYGAKEHWTQTIRNEL